jgi:tRNA(Ile)-lysidine synthetase-like protein
LPARGIHLEFQLGEPQDSGQAYDRVGDELDWQRLTSETSAGIAEPGLLEVRNWRPGDRYRRLGKIHDEKIKLFFQENRIPLWERRNWPVLICRGTIVWTRRFGVAAEFAAGPESRKVLRVHEKAANGR